MITKDEVEQLGNDLHKAMLEGKLPRDKNRRKAVKKIIEFNSFDGGKFKILIPPNVPGLKRLYKRANRLVLFLETHPRKKK